MCGRYILYSDKEEKAVRAIVDEVNRTYQIELKKGDIYPTDLAPVYEAQPDQQGMELKLKKWGYAQHYGKKSLLINARSETVLEKVTFREDFLKRRCLIPAFGFYEWNAKKEKFFFTGSDGLIFLGGIFHLQAGAADTFVIMTKPPVTPVVQVHDRMPVIIPGERALDFLYSAEDARKIMTENQVLLDREKLT